LVEVHRDNLRARGFSEAEIALVLFATLPRFERSKLADRVRAATGLTTNELLTVPGFVSRKRGDGRELAIHGPPGLLIPTFNRDGLMVGIRIRLDNPEPGTGKYRWMTSATCPDWLGPSPGAPLYHPPVPSQIPDVVRLTEGEFKSLIATSRTGVYTLGCPGVGAWKLGMTEALARGATAIRLAFDADLRDNPAVARALVMCARRVVGLGLALEVESWDATHKGIDDALAAAAAIDVLSGDRAVAFVLDIAR
jgi:hypothetical protein